MKDQVYKVVMRWPGLNRTRAIVYIRWEKLPLDIGVSVKGFSHQVHRPRFSQLFK